MIESFFEIQLVQFRIMMTEFHVISDSSGSFSSSRESKAPGQNINNIVNNNKVTPRFLVNDIGFFNPFYKNKSSNTETEIEHAKKKIYFRNIIIFIDKIKNITKIKKIELLYNNF